MMKISKPIRLLQGSLLVAALAFAGQLARANDLFTNPRASEPPMVLAQAAPENEAAEKAKASQLQNQIRGDEAELKQMQAEEAKEPQTGPVPPTINEIKDAIHHLRLAMLVMRRLPNHYEGYRSFAEQEDGKAQVALIHCIVIDKQLAKKQQH